MTSALLIVIFEMLHSVLATYLVSPLLARDTMTEMNRAVPMKTDGMTEMTEVREAKVLTCSVSGSIPIAIAFWKEFEFTVVLF